MALINHYFPKATPGKGGTLGLKTSQEVNPAHEGRSNVSPDRLNFGAKLASVHLGGKHMT